MKVNHTHLIPDRYYDYVAKSREIPTPAAKQCLLLDN